MSFKRMQGKDVLTALNIEGIAKLNTFESENITKPFTENEIVCAMNQLNISSSCGGDELNARRAIKYQELLVPDLVKVLNPFWDQSSVEREFLTSVGILFKI